MKYPILFALAALACGSPATPAEAPEPAAVDTPEPATKPAPDPGPSQTELTVAGVGPFRIGMPMANARALRGFRYEDGRTGEEGAIAIVTAFRGSERHVTLFPSDAKLGGLVARSATLHTPEGVHPGMRAKQVFEVLKGKAPKLIVACEDSEGTSINFGDLPYEFIFSACGIDTVRNEDAELVGIGIP